MAAERNDKGQFIKGWAGGPGRPTKEREERFMEIALSAVTFDDWRTIVKKAVTQAKRGDHMARKWLGDYLMGTPVQKTELTGADGAPLIPVSTVSVHEPAEGAGE